MFILYTVAPILYRMASSAYYNLSLLSSDFYGLLFGLFLFVSLLPDQNGYVIQTSCRATVRTGCTSSPMLSSSAVSSSTSGLRRVSCLRWFLILVYSAYQNFPNSAEEQGKLDPTAPAYVNRRGDNDVESEEGGAVPSLVY